MKSVWMLGLAIAIGLPVALSRADDEKKGEEPKQEKKVEVKVFTLDGEDEGNPKVRVFVQRDNDDETEGKQPFLGVAIEPVPAALAAHLGELVPQDQGVMVSDVVDDSPAAKAGLTTYDIVLTYGDQKVTSTDQLTSLVRGDKAGREVTLGIVRAGKAQKISAVIGEREAAKGFQIITGEPGRVFRLEGPDGPRVRAEVRKKRGDSDRPRARAGARTKSEFTSLRLESLDGDRFKAEVEYKSEKGDTLKRTFEGTRDEIRKEIEADEELPEGIRDQLMRSMEMGQGGRGAFHFNMPRGGFWIDTGFEDMWARWPGMRFPDGRSFDQFMEEFSENLDPELREKLEGALRSLEQPGKRPVPRERSL